MTPAHVLGVLGASCVAPLDDADHLLASLELPDAPHRAYPNHLDLDVALLEDPVRALSADSAVTDPFLPSPHSLQAFPPMPPPITQIPSVVTHPPSDSIIRPPTKPVRGRPTKRARADPPTSARSPKRTRRACVKNEPTTHPSNAPTTVKREPTLATPAASDSCPMMGQLAARVGPEQAPLPLPTRPDPAVTAAAATGSQSALSRRAQRVIRTREAATRNRMEQRAKMTRLKETNERLCRQSADLLSENRRLQSHVQLMMSLKADPALLRRVLAAVDARVATV